MKAHAFVIGKYISGKAKLLLNVGGFFFIQNCANHILAAMYFIIKLKGNYNKSQQSRFIEIQYLTRYHKQTKTNIM